jgi:hypothetical protein
MFGWYVLWTASISSRYKISKYPTLKLLRNGVPVKKEYRGQRSAEAFAEFIAKQLENPVKEFSHLREIMNLDVSCYYSSILKIRNPFNCNGIK